jgi:hypothetical protein
VRLLVERIAVTSPDGADIRLRTAGLTNMVAVRAVRPETRRATMPEPNPTANGRAVTVRVPISIRRRGGRAFRWRDMLESGRIRNNQGDRRCRERSTLPTSAASCG